MAVLLRVGLLLLSILFISACGSEDLPRQGPAGGDGASVSDPEAPVTPPTDTPPDTTPDPDPTPDDGDDSAEPPDEEEPVEEEPPVEEPGETPVPPAPSRPDTHVFFPIIPGMELYFDNEITPTVLGDAEVINSDITWPLEYDDVLSNYFTSTADTVGLKGVRVLLLERAEPVYLNVMFANSRPILGDANSYNTTGSTRVRVTGIPLVFTMPVRLTATLDDNEWVNIAGMAPQPARRIHVNLRLSVSWIERLAILAAYPWLAPAFDPVEFDLWLVPGIGVVGVQQGSLHSQVQAVEGVPEPLVFAIARDANVDNIAPRMLLVNGEPVTDITWDTTVFYRTAASDWLDVQFDSTGSWRARVTRSDLPRGIHAATVRFQQGEVQQDVTVSLMVE